MSGATNMGTMGECTAGRELVVVIRPRGLLFWSYEGTRAQLEAEGVIPADLQWPLPEHGRHAVHWELGRQRFTLCRTRPADLKGPMSAWIRGDWWELRCDLLGAPSYMEQQLLDAKRELARAQYRQSPEGQRAFDAHWARYWPAQKDAAFQAMLRRIVPQPARRSTRGEGGAA